MNASVAGHELAENESLISRVPNRTTSWQSTSGMTGTVIACLKDIVRLYHLQVSIC